MPSALPRITMTVKKKVYRDVERIAKNSDKSVAEVARDFVIFGLEFMEDAGLIMIAEERRKKGKKSISHSQLMKELGL